MSKPESKQAMTDALAAFMNEDGRTARPAAAESEGRAGNTLAAAYGDIVASYGKPVAGGAPAPASAGKQQLVDAYDKLVEHEAAKPKEPYSYERPVPAWRKYGVPVVGILAFAATAYLWIARPAWLYPDFAPPRPPANAAMAQRALIAGSIIMQNYHARTGRYPGNLREAGVDLPWMSAMPAGDGGFSLMLDAATGRMMLQAPLNGPFRMEGLSK